MRMLRIAGEGVNSLAANKVRTFLMMAGTIVGIAALTVIMSIGKGTEKKIMKQVDNFGPTAMMVIAGGGRALPPPDTSVTTLTLADAEAIREQVDGVRTVAPQAWQFDVNLKYQANQIQSVVWGVEPNWHSAWAWDVAQGDGITDQDVATMSRVCVIGDSVGRDLFAGTDPVGKSLYINKVSLTVKGVLERRGTAGGGGGDFDNRIVIPITTAMRRVMNVDHIGAIRVVSEDASLMAQQAEQIEQIIRSRHHITPAVEDDFRIVTPTIIAELARGTSRTFSILLIALAALSLLVGGIVLMNIMLISVAERTNEIGLRRALGATRSDVFVQFLTESLSVTFLGMLLGSLLGAAVAIGIAKLTPLPAMVTWQPFALSIAFALLVGTVSGVQPAWRAARLSPVEALR
ncbi:Macrolide export ATP-binding/permease protein MacB [Novipirellula aureliae]|uniref:Macrolide export ATP-binding/permease protein MacB n=1 Tax=Novipirellula aureliae TaxID=2527966 RepID=A0A5C6DMG5_9BACT|nr:ABC transporter permease [Novipirellula aureliae]TWU37832.1 Macrolide export ATP-binding/permease protein MacB [Novipirellula aureliae]